MKKYLLHFTLLYVVMASANLLQAQTDKFTYAVTDMNKNGTSWSAIRKLDLNTGEYSPVLFNGFVYDAVAFDAASKKQLIRDATNSLRMATPFSTGVAAMAYDKKNNRLYYTPMFIDQLRYIDLSTMKLYYVNDQAFAGFGDWNQDQGKIVTRMVIAPDGNGYAITNDGSQFIKFTTGRKVAITRLGALTDHPANKEISIHTFNICYGGDMISTDDGSFYLITSRNHVFKINKETKVAKHLGTIKDLPQKFTTNGVAVDDKGSLLISSTADTTGWFVVDPSNLNAVPFKAVGSSVFRCSDLANSNILSLRKDITNVPVIAQQQVGYSNKVQVYPNPVTENVFTLEFNNLNKGAYTVEVLDITGRRIMQKKINLGFSEQIQKFNLPSAQAKGIYLIRVIDINKKNVFEQKLLLQ